jgi:beta-ureidopropionase / N-carbamoyl-L-amino-acid hydrolase
MPFSTVGEPLTSVVLHRTSRGVVYLWMPADPANVVADLKELRALTATEEGSQRLAWTEPWQRARDWWVSTFDGTPVEVETDVAGNLWVTLVGESRNRIVLGSHLDSVPNGGWLDGALGVLAGGETLRALHRDLIETGAKLPVSISVVDWADEEGARFGRSLFGSGAVSGTLEVATVRHFTDRNGAVLQDVVAPYGVNMDTILTAGDILPSIVASAELHIEQGPVLEAKGRQLAALHGILGVERRLVKIKGQAAHAGATPIHMRKDSTLAAARMAIAIRELAIREGAFATVGVWKVHPMVPTAVNGRTEFSVDMRHLDIAVLNRMVAGLEALVADIAADERCEADIEMLWSINPIDFHPDLIEFAADVVEARTGIREIMPSGPMHDSAEMARAGVPTIMMFVPSINGLSHTHIEDTAEADIELGVAAFDDLVVKMVDWAAARVS